MAIVIIVINVDLYVMVYMNAQNVQTLQELNNINNIFTEEL